MDEGTNEWKDCPSTLKIESFTCPLTHCKFSFIVLNWQKKAHYLLVNFSRQTHVLMCKITCTNPGSVGGQDGQGLDQPGPVGNVPAWD